MNSIKSIIGITGGIASGKSKLLKYLSGFKYVKTINMDKEIHNLYNINPFLKRELANRFGAQILKVDQFGNSGVDRVLLGEIVFNNSDALNSLNHIALSEGRNYFNCLIRSIYLNNDIDIIFVEGAVIIEAKWNDLFNQIWCTLLSKEEAVQRVVQRNPNLSQMQAEQRISSQISDQERMKHCTFYYDTIPPFSKNQTLIINQLHILKHQGKLRNVIKFDN